MTVLGHRPKDPSSRRVIVLMGLRGCSEREAFDDLVARVHETGISLGSLAGALVGLAGGGDVPVVHRSAAAHRWGDLMALRVASAHSAVN